MIAPEVVDIVEEYFHGKYKVEQFLESSEFAEIYIVRHVFLDDLRVMKIIKEPFDINSNLNFLLYGARLACKLKHENIIDINDAGIIPAGDKNENDWVYFIMEYVLGGDLTPYMMSFKESNILMPIFWGLSLIKQILLGLNKLHSSQPPIVHNDLKPSNILLSFNSEYRIVVKISDFGFSREINSNMDNHIIVGTRQYMAPECFKNKYYPSTDIYALGVVFYILLTNHFPYDMDRFNLAEIIDGKPWKSPLIPPSNYNNNVSPLIDEIVSKCLQADYNNRFLNAGELLTEIEKCFRKSYLHLNENDYGMNNAMKKAFRLAKYENNFSEAKVILKDYDMGEIFEKVMNFDKEQNSFLSQTIKLKTSHNIKSKEDDFLEEQKK